VGNEGVGAVIDKGIVMEIIRNEDWHEVAKYLRELRRDLRRGFERLNECLTCPANVTFCSEVARLVESFNRALLAVLMLRCFLNDALGVVEDGRTRRRLNEVLEVANSLAAFLNGKHGLVHQLMGKCKQFWGGGS
jgi:predicted metal-binding protein